MPGFPRFHGNAALQEALNRMILQDRIPQTLLLAGPEGVGKATLARRFAATLLDASDRIEQDDLSLPHNMELMAEREKLPADKRADEPLLIATYPDFITFPPDGPLRQISIQQMRMLKDRARFGPLRGRWRVFLIDHVDRANEQAANSLLKTLEEPPPHLIVIMTAENSYDLLPTIRSRAVPFYLSPLPPGEMAAFARERAIDPTDPRFALAGGCPGLAVTLDLELYDKRRNAMLALLKVSAGRAPFATWARYSESIGASRTEKLEFYIKTLYALLEDVLLAQQGVGVVRNIDLRSDLDELGKATSFEWIWTAIRKVDELVELGRRNIQKGIALDALALELRRLV